MSLSTRQRRQNNSCDQCRDGKRRCDVRISDITTSNLTKHSQCSNCTKWKKSCTIKWITSRQDKSQPASPTAKRMKTSSPQHHHNLNHHHHHHHHHHSGSNRSLSRTVTSESSSDVNHCALNFDPGAERPENFDNRHSGPHCRIIDYDNEPAFTDSKEEFAPDCSVGKLGPDICNFNADFVDNHSFRVGWHEQSSVVANMNLSGSSSSSLIEHDRTLIQEQGYGDQLSNASSQKNDNSNRPLSPFTSQLLADDHQKLFIKGTLLKVYHDSLEGALSCWLTERNCPYTISLFDGKDVWSSSWTNRIIRRVCELDRIYSNAGLLSRSDQKQASNVLNLVIMAFAAQWSQTGERGTSRLPNGSPLDSGSQKSMNPATDDDYFSQLDDEIFGRNMQKSLWYKANKALGEAFSNVSFRVIFAGIIFSLTQRPIDRTGVLQNIGSAHQNPIDSVQRILDMDGPPISLDIALRKLHDHQRHLDEAKLAPSCNAPRLRAPRQLSSTHKESFGLLYWLAVMFDTLSAAVNRRSFTICDADSNFNALHAANEERSLAQSRFVDLDGWSGLPEAPVSSPVSESSIWGAFFLRPKARTGEFRKHNTRWPCSYVDAAACLADAAPVKVLLFRRVAHLQDLHFRHTSAQDIEIALESVLEVYNHWNDTYGLFIDDCVAKHEDLPARIQSWYILLAGHWNLAVLILADLIDSFDESYMTMILSRCKRQSIQLSKTLRIRAVTAVSDLGRCSRYGENDLSFSQAPDFHDAVNKAALLTEPWTMVLVRSFGFAGTILAKDVLSQQNGGADSTDFPDAKTRLQYCIDALWLLGKKSDMALCAAQVLKNAVS